MDSRIIASSSGVAIKTAPITRREARSIASKVRVPGSNSFVQSKTSTLHCALRRSRTCSAYRNASLDEPMKMRFMYQSLLFQLTTRVTGRRELALLSKSAGDRRSGACDGVRPEVVILDAPQFTATASGNEVGSEKTVNEVWCHLKPSDTCAGNQTWEAVATMGSLPVALARRSEIGAERRQSWRPTLRRRGR